jgi:hypothetical protein
MITIPTQITGILLVLAILALHLLLSRPEVPGNRYFIAITGTMLFLSTTQAVLQPALVLFEFRLLSEELAGDLDAMAQTAWTCQVILFAQAVVQVTNVYDRCLLPICRWLIVSCKVARRRPSCVFLPMSLGRTDDLLSDRFTGATSFGAGTFILLSSPSACLQPAQVKSPSH